MPKLSVVLPMQDHRGLACRSIESWTHKQDCSHDDFELIILCDATTQELWPKFKELLRANDSFVSMDDLDITVQYDWGARNAKGEYLLLAEPHCIALSNTVSECLLGFSTENFDGFCGNSKQIGTCHIGEMEVVTFDEGFVEWIQPNHWNKVIIRSFALKKEVYIKCGGLDLGYFHFSESMLGIKLHSQGYSIGYWPKMEVIHYCAHSFPFFDEYLRYFLQGDFKFRMEFPELSEKYLGLPTEWDKVGMLNPALNTMIRKDLKLAQKKNLAQNIFFLFQSFQYWWVYTIGLVPRNYLGEIKIFLSKLRSYCWKPFSKRYSVMAFKEYLANVANLVYCQCMAKNPIMFSFSDNICLSEKMSEIPSQRLMGFYGIESYQGHSFRWTNPIAGIPIRLAVNPKQDVRLSIQLLPNIYKRLDRRLSMVINHKNTIDFVYDDSSASITCILPKESLVEDGKNWLSLFCSPYVRSSKKERRCLALPIISIYIIPIESGENG